MKQIWIIGAGGHAKVVIDAIRASGGYEIRGILDDGVASGLMSIDGIPVLGPVEPDVVAREGVTRAILAIGSNRVRQDLARRLGKLVNWEAIKHPSAIIADSATISEGTFIAAGAVVQPDATLGPHTILNTRSSVDHDCDIGSFAHIAPAVCLTGSVKVGEGAFIGAGSTVIPGRVIGAWATVGAGAVVIRDVPAHATAMGVPARIVGDARDTGDQP